MVQLVTSLLGLLAAGVILLLMRNDRLHAQLGLGWVVVAVGFALLGLSPGIFDRLARLFDINYPPVLALTLAIIILVIKILLMDIQHSHVETRNQRLVQRVAMLETELRRVHSALENRTTRTDGTGGGGQQPQQPKVPPKPADDT